MATPLPLLNNDELVTVAFLASITGLSAAMAGTQLPPDTDDTGAPAAWLQTGFVTVATVGGTPDALLPVHRPVMEVKCWAAVPGSNKPPWMAARAIASVIEREMWDRRTLARPVTPVFNGVAYPLAVVQAAYLAQSFRRVYDDPGDYACYQADMALQWMSPGDSLA